MKILYVTTISNTVNAFLISHIELLIEQGHQVDVAFNIVEEVSPKLIKNGCKVYNIEFQRSPLTKQNYMAYKKLKKIIIEEKYDLVHTHTPVASACVRFACRRIKDIKVFYTAHGFHFFKGAPIKNWLIYYPIEKWLARYTDVLITINNEDYVRAKKSFKAGKVEYIPGVGFDSSKFANAKFDRNEKRRELGIPEDASMVLSVGELNVNKNHKTVIDAISEIKDSKIYYCICGNGPLNDYLEKYAEEMGIGNQLHLLGFRNDIAEICKSADIFIFPSKREGLPVSLMEAMASGLPVVCSNIRGNTDLIIEQKGGFICSPTDANEYKSNIKKLLESTKLRKKYGGFNAEWVKKFDINNVLPLINSIYSETSSTEFF
jgi:glycosyltransferase involved in cell wall biosynthesis